MLVLVEMPAARAAHLSHCGTDVVVTIHPFQGHDSLIHDCCSPDLIVFDQRYLFYHRFDPPFPLYCKAMTARQHALTTSNDGDGTSH